MPVVTITLKLDLPDGVDLSWASAPPQQRPVVQSPEDITNLVMLEMAAMDQEHLRVLVLNARNEVLSIEDVYKGNVNSSMVRPSNY